MTMLNRRRFITGVIGSAVASRLPQAIERPGTTASRTAPASGPTEPPLPHGPTAPVGHGGSTPDGVWSYGHSFAIDNYPYIPDRRHGEYARLVAAALRVPVDLNARSGTKLLDTVRAIVAPTFAGSTARRWVEGSGNGRHVVLLENVHNDESSGVGSDPAYRSGYDLALRLSLAAFGARSKILAAQADSATIGAWHVTQQPDRAPGGAMSYTKTYGAKMSFTVTGDECHIATVVCDADELKYGTMRIEVAGKVVGYFNGTGKMRAYVDTVDDTTLNRWSPAGIRVTGMDALAGTSGAKVLTIRKIGNDTTPIWVSAVYLRAAQPPRVFVALEPPRNPDATAQNGVTAFYANDPAFRSLIRTACSAYSYATVVDLAPGWDNETMVATGVDPYNFHPNDLGMEHIADAFLTAIDA